MKNKHSYLDGDDIAAGCSVVLLSIGVLLLSLFLLPAIEMWLWNGNLINLFPELPAVSYWQMFGLNWLCHLLFKGGSTISTSSSKKK